MTNGKGNSQIIKTRTQTLDATCGNLAEMHATAHVVATDLTRFVEVGWFVWQDSVGVRHCQVFWESFDGNSFTGGPGNGPLVPCDAFMGWKLWVQPASTRWKFWYDPELDGSYLQVGPLYGANPGFSSGLPEGETGRHGLGGSYDHHDVLRYNTVGGDTGWTVWPGVALDFDDETDYHLHVLAQDNYEVVHD